MDSDMLTMRTIREWMETSRKGKMGVEQVTEMRRQALQSNGQYITGMDYRDDLYADIFTKGTQILYPHGQVMQYGNLQVFPTFYRGEITDYRTPCKSTLGRKIKGLASKSADAEIILSHLRVHALQEVITKLDQVKHWKFGDVFSYMIAQHYGVETPFLDITDDIDVAMFFASCIHKGKNKYRPFKASDFSQYGEYAVLYVRYAMDPLTFGDQDMISEDVLPIGYQPFMRCARQRGYFVATYGKNSIADFDLEKDLNFIKYRFKRSIKFSKEIFEHFNGGDDLFPYESTIEVTDVIDNIKAARIFSSDIFEKALWEMMDSKRLSNRFSKDEWLSILEDEAIVIGNKYYSLSPDKVKRINKNWDETIFVEQEHLAPGSRKVAYSI